MNYRGICFVLACILVMQSFAQLNPFEIREYDFIEYDNNELKVNENPNLEGFFSKLDTLILRGRGKINIVHIGDSHIQADYVSGQVRKRFQQMAWGLNGGRGFVFPVKVAKTNNPWNYKVRYTGKWETCKNIQHTKNCNIGLAGFVASTQSEKSSIHITFTDADYPSYEFNRLRIFHEFDTSQWQIQLMDTSIHYCIDYNVDSMCSVLFFEENQNFLDLQIIKKGTTGKYVLHGLSFENDDAGIVYHSVGVNGAEVESWLNSPLMPNELECLSPDLVIVSLGTNDSYTSKFDASSFESNMKELISRIKQAAPKAAIMWVTPGDNYRYRKYLNYSTQKATQAIARIAKEENVMVWDFFDVMGELNAIMKWYYAGLTARDKLHYNQKGYILQGNLMFNAILRAYNQHIDKN